jgi:hypothetical protein
MPTQAIATPKQIASNIQVINCYCITKAGNHASECEDAYAWEQKEGSSCFAIADGATESSFAQKWAQDLVTRFVGFPLWQANAAIVTETTKQRCNRDTQDGNDNQISPEHNDSDRQASDSSSNLNNSVDPAASQSIIELETDQLTDLLAASEIDPITGQTIDLATGQATDPDLDSITNPGTVKSLDPIELRSGQSSDPGETNQVTGAIEDNEANGADPSLANPSAMNPLNSPDHQPAKLHSPISISNDRYHNNPLLDLSNWLMPLQLNWAKWILEQELVWYAKRKVEQGTFATLLGLEIDTDNCWRSMAIGDSCLFVVRDGKLLHSFPIETASQFNHRPNLIGTLLNTETFPNQILKRSCRGGRRILSSHRCTGKLDSAPD